MNIIVKELLYKPSSSLNNVKIFGELFCETIISPNLFVVKTNEDLKEGMNILFQKDGLEYSLENITPTEKDDKIYIECKFWQETLIDY